MQAQVAPLTPCITFSWTEFGQVYCQFGVINWLLANICALHLQALDNIYSQLT